MKRLTAPNFAVVLATVMKQDKNLYSQNLSLKQCSNAEKVSLRYFLTIFRNKDVAICHQAQTNIRISPVLLFRKNFLFLVIYEMNQLMDLDQ